MVSTTFFSQNVFTLPDKRIHCWYDCPLSKMIMVKTIMTTQILPSKIWDWDRLLCDTMQKWILSCKETSKGAFTNHPDSNQDSTVLCCILEDLRGRLEKKTWTSSGVKAQDWPLACQCRQPTFANSSNSLYLETQPFCELTLSLAKIIIASRQSCKTNPVQPYPEVGYVNNIRVFTRIRFSLIQILNRHVNRALEVLHS